jgi:hypothetical protein
VHGLAEADATSKGSDAGSFFVLDDRCELGPYVRRARSEAYGSDFRAAGDHRMVLIKSNQRNTLAPVEIFDFAMLVSKSFSSMATELTTSELFAFL